MIRKCDEHGYFRGGICPRCQSPGRYVLDDTREEKLGRFVSGALRHFPDSAGVEMDPCGWVSLENLCNILMKRYRWLRKWHLYALVESDVKGRYEIKGGRIRARYGHSVNVDLDYEESNLPYVYYGASPEELDMLLENGIIPVKQRYVHLSTSFEKANEVASVHTDNPIILKIDARAVQEEGFSLMYVNDYIVLAEKIPPVCLERI
ncbi:MAG: RNA 2'-phosphotransferase [Methanosarcinaceae archaeon]|nr:RNA 2'-phosphotransferase [Methanosarcinaceae archaeon]MDD4331752.1 RNA 2'-phosphotransferase [Methanosarcinaceae archaeon]MDD4748354.1 RNA 2'-phosphotransferase [Methanosarcinaceae archaeon]